MTMVASCQDPPASAMELEMPELGNVDPARLGPFSIMLNPLADAKFSPPPVEQGPGSHGWLLEVPSISIEMDKPTSGSIDVLVNPAPQNPLSGPMKVPFNYSFDPGVFGINDPTLELKGEPPDPTLTMGKSTPTIPVDITISLAMKPGPHGEITGKVTNLKPGSLIPSIRSRALLNSNPEAITLRSMRFRAIFLDSGQSPFHPAQNGDWLEADIGVLDDQPIVYDEPAVFKEARGYIATRQGKFLAAKIHGFYDGKRALKLGGALIDPATQASAGDFEATFYLKWPTDKEGNLTDGPVFVSLADGSLSGEAQRALANTQQHPTYWSQLTYCTTSSTQAARATAAAGNLSLRLSTGLLNSTP